MYAGSTIAGPLPEAGTEIAYMFDPEGPFSNAEVYDSVVLARIKAWISRGTVRMPVHSRPLLPFLLRVLRGFHADVELSAGT